MDQLQVAAGPAPVDLPSNEAQAARLTALTPSQKPDERARSPPPAPLPTAPKPLADPLNPRIEALTRDTGSRPRSRAGTPRSKPRPSRPGTPKDGAAVGDMAARPLNVTDALSYLDAVKNKFSDKPDVYNHFLDIMKEFKSQQIDTPGVIERVSMLFQGNADLIQGFNTFLPPGYHIECTTDASQQNIITVTTPQGIMTQGGHTLNRLRFPRDAMGQPTPLPTPLPGMPAPFALGSGLPSAIPPLGTGAASRPATPHAFPTSHIHNPFLGGPQPYSPGVQGSTNAAATFLGGLNNQTRQQPAEKPQGEFNHAIQYLNKIKTRYAEDPNTYKQFLEILQAYQKDQRNLEDSQVYAQVQILFKDAPELIDEFKAFLPEALGVPAPVGSHVGILPHPPGGSVVGGSSWGPGEPSSALAPAEKARAPNRRRKRPVEQETTPVLQPKSTSSRSKKLKTQVKADVPSPADSPHQAPISPNAYAAIQQEHVLASQQPHQAAAYQQQGASTAHMPMAHFGYPRSPTDGDIFFERVKTSMVSPVAYGEFLKLLDMFTRDVIDSQTLIRRAERFLGDSDLMASFRDLLGWDDREGSIAYGPPGSIRTGPPEAMTATPVDDGQGPSYRRLPESEVRLACSGRDELARSVLNDCWVSHPTWASEEAGFVAHKKNSFEEALHKSEEERHEYTVLIQGLARTIAVLDPLNERIESMDADERAEFKLLPDLGGPAPAIYLRTLKKVYRDAGTEIHRALQDSPAVAIPVVLARLKQKDEEWRRAQREWSRTWREVDHKNFYKSLDHQGITFKVNDKKAITARHFVVDIEAAKAEQAHRRRAEQPFVPAFAHGSAGPQLEYALTDADVMQDALGLVYAYLDHNSAYHAVERRAIESFLREFMPTLLMVSPQAFNARSGLLMPTGVPDITMEPGDSKTDKLVNGEVNSPQGGDRSSAAESFKEKAKLRDNWIREATNSMPDDTILFNNRPVTRRPFFANTTFYTLLRLLQLLYARLSACKEVGAKLAAERYASLAANPVAVELGLDEPNSASAVLRQAVEAFSPASGMDGKTNVLYMYLLDSCQKLFDADMDQATFEEHMRWFFGTKAFHTFTLDKVVAVLIKQAQTITCDGKCDELWELLKRSRAPERLTGHDIIHYRREAELHAGADEHLYRIEWQPSTATLQIQLLNTDDPSVDEAHQPVERWREYVDTYVTRHPTEWKSPPSGRSRRGLGPFLRRCLPQDETAATDQMLMENDLAVRISLGTYKIFYEAGTEDTIYRRSMDAELETKAKTRSDERRRKWRSYTT